MTPTALHFVVLLVAGALAGVVGSAGGITSLISYPALLLIGIAPLPATFTNSVALVACWPGSALTSRPELQNQGPWLRRWIPVVAAGSAVGAVLLLSTPAGLFDRVVPFLVALAALALLLQPQLSAWQRSHALLGNRKRLLPLGLFSLSAYNGYFGAGAGVMVLVLLLLLVDQHFPKANALKNMLVGAASVVAAVAFIFFGTVKWTAVAPLALGLFVGSTIGPFLARRIPSNWLRVVVALSGLGLALHLWIAPG
ncbi:MAG: sulfite exporter TauE/SafE family protein [Candidatus Dormiibacterota bacterium]